jgi:hypothetical protein
VRHHLLLTMTLMLAQPAPDGVDDTHDRDR